MTIGNKLEVTVISSPLLWIHTEYCVPADANMHLRNITLPTGPHAAGGTTITSVHGGDTSRLKAVFGYKDFSLLFNSLCGSLT